MSVFKLVIPTSIIFISKKAKIAKDILYRKVPIAGTPTTGIAIATFFTLQFLQGKKQKAGRCIIIC